LITLSVEKTATKTVLLTDPIAAEGEAALARGAQVVRAPDSAPPTIRRLARDADGVITRSKLPDDLFIAAPRVRAVVVHGTGTDLVPLASAAEHGVPIANLPGSNAQSVAEYCVMAMLMLARNALPIIASLRSGTWDAARALGAGTHEISAMTLGVVGVGEIGKRVAKICRQGFGMRVLGCQRRLDKVPPDCEPASLPALLGQSDFVVVTCPLTPETQHLFNRDAFARMKPSAWLINVGRGAVVQEGALVGALRAGRIAGAMLDVYESYRLEPGHHLFDVPNLVLTPHLAGMTRESRARMGVAAAEEMLRMLAGEPPRNPVHAHR
jgi:D-3-phosphoglycerate dehydrogenase